MSNPSLEHEILDILANSDSFYFLLNSKFERAQEGPKARHLLDQPGSLTSGDLKQSIWRIVLSALKDRYSMEDIESAINSVMSANFVYMNDISDWLREKNPKRKGYVMSSTKQPPKLIRVNGQVYRLAASDYDYTSSGLSKTMQPRSWQPPSWDWKHDKDKPAAEAVAPEMIMFIDEIDDLLAKKPKEEAKQLMPIVKAIRDALQQQSSFGEGVSKLKSVKSPRGGSAVPEPAVDSITQSLLLLDEVDEILRKKPEQAVKELRPIIQTIMTNLRKQKSFSEESISKLVSVPPKGRWPTLKP